MTERSGRTTDLLDHALDVAVCGTLDQEPELWRYVWAYFLAVVSFGGFKYHKYLEKFTTRRKWDVFFIIASQSQLHSVQGIVAELMAQKHLDGSFRDGGREISFPEEYLGAGTLRFVSFGESILQMAVGRQNFYPIFDHYTLECYSLGGTSQDHQLIEEICRRGEISRNTANANSHN